MLGPGTPEEDFRDCGRVVQKISIVEIVECLEAGMPSLGLLCCRAVQLSGQKLLGRAIKIGYAQPKKGQ